MGTVFALWRRLDMPGHDAALLVPNGAGWTLRGAAVFTHEAGPACIAYTVDLDCAWKAQRGAVRGFIAQRQFDHVIERRPAGWHVDGARIEGLDHLADLDFGFTPATNLPHLRRLALPVGAAADLPVAWFDLDGAPLSELPQRYERRSDLSYWYRSPTTGYEALLELAPDGFVKVYPRLWTME